MCGRYAYYKEHPELRAQAAKEIDEHGSRLPPRPLFTQRWNIAPTQRAPVLRLDGDGTRSVDLLRWGLVPGWAKDLGIGARAINARSEEAAGKPMFRSAWKSRRCVVPASGFYEWTTTKPKRAWYFRPADDEGLAFAGLWESWTDKATGEVVETYTVLTRAPYDVVRPVHDRSPLILPADRWTAWLDPGTRDVGAVLDAPPPDLVAVPVGDAVGSPRNEGPSLVEPVAAG